MCLLLFIWCVCVFVSIRKSALLWMHKYFLSLCLMDCCVIIIYLTCLNVQESSSIYYFLLFLLKEKDWKKKEYHQMFTEEQRSWQLPDELIWVRWFFICFLNFCSETRTAAADGSVKQTSSGWCPDMVLVAPPPTSAPFLRPPEGQASWGPWSVWPGKSFHHWTVHPPFCRSGTCWETQWVWSGSSAGCRVWAASCWGWPQTPDGGGR